MTHEEQKERISAVVHSASERVDLLRKSLPDTTRGMFEFALMLRLIEKGVPVIAEWARSENFIEHFTSWVLMGCPELPPDDATAMLETFKGKWVH